MQNIPKGLLEQEKGMDKNSKIGGKQNENDAFFYGMKTKRISKGAATVAEWLYYSMNIYLIFN